MVTTKNKAIQFLKEKKILLEDKTQFIIRFEDGRKVDVVDLLEEFGKVQFSEGLQSEAIDE